MRRFLVGLAMVWLVTICWLAGCGGGGLRTIVDNSGPTASTNCIVHDWAELVGPIEPGLEYRTAEGFLLRANGFDRLRRSESELGLVYLNEHGGAELGQQFLAGISSVDLANQVDVAYRDVLRGWLDCEGKFTATALAFNPRDYTIEVMSRPFCLNRQWAGGAAWKNSKLIRCVFVTADSLGKEGQSLRWFRDYIRWEIGNSFAFAHGIVPRSVAEEVGDQVPCKR